MRQGELGVMRAGRSDSDLDATDGDGDAGAEFEQLRADAAAGRLRQLGVRQTGDGALTRKTYATTLRDSQEVSSGMAASLFRLTSTLLQEV
jgi:hypothetical protein